MLVEILIIGLFLSWLFLRFRRPPRATRTVTLFPYTSRFRAGDAFGAGELVDAGEGLVAGAAFGRVDDAFEGEIVGTLVDEAEIGERVADLGAFVEAKTPDDAIGEADRDEEVRAEERRVGKECVRTCRSRWLPSH